MYRYDDVDRASLAQRVAQFRDQTARFLAGELSEEQFRPLRLSNGLYMERFGPMLRVAIPYGQLSSGQLHRLAHIARTYDRGFGHVTTRQDIQFNWPRLEQVPDILAELAEVEMHALQTGGGGFRNITCDPLSGVDPDELEDPRPFCEIIRQWLTRHPEFSSLPHKLKIAVSGAEHDRSAIEVHDIGIRLRPGAGDEPGFQILVGGGLGRMPLIAHLIRPWLPQRDLLAYLESVLRVYNRHGRRDNPGKARIKMLVRTLGAEEFTRQVEAEFGTDPQVAPRLEPAEVERMRRFFAAPPYQTLPDDPHAAQLAAGDPQFTAWYTHNTSAHRVPGYRVVVASLKKSGEAPGDVTAAQMDALAALADRVSFGMLRVTHDQNLVLADVRQSDLLETHTALSALGLGSPTVGTLTDMICCPGLDFCGLASAATIPIARQIQARFADLDYLYDLGPVRIKMSGCVNGCGHHQLADVGILGVGRYGEEWYRILLGGSPGNPARLGQVIGAAVKKSALAATVAKILEIYVRERRTEHESFLETVLRLGIEPFRESVYEVDHPTA